MLQARADEVIEETLHAAVPGTFRNRVPSRVDSAITGMYFRV